MSVNGNFKSTIIGCGLRATFAIAIIWDISMFKSHAKKHDKPTFITRFCQNKTCVELDMRKVLKFYPSLFVPVDKNMFEFERKMNPGGTCTRTYIEPRTYSVDGGSYCPTELLFDHSKNRTNVHGKERVIVRTLQLQQLIPIGRCKKGKCRICSLVYRTMSILVVNFFVYKSLPVEFDQFQIPMYCTC